MQEVPTTIDIYPQDEENSQAIIAKIRAENITDEAQVKALVSNNEFSSPETKQHILDGIIYLLREGAFNGEPPVIIEMNI